MAAGERFARVAGTVLGPFSVADLKRMAATGRLGPSDEIAFTAAGPWRTAAELGGLAFGSSPNAPLVAAPVVDPSTPAASNSFPWYFMVAAGAVTAMCIAIAYAALKRADADTQKAIAAKPVAAASADSVARIDTPAANPKKEKPRLPCTRQDLLGTMSAFGMPMRPVLRSDFSGYEIEGVDLFVSFSGTGDGLESVALLFNSSQQSPERAAVALLMITKTATQSSTEDITAYWPSMINAAVQNQSRELEGKSRLMAGFETNGCSVSDMCIGTMHAISIKKREH